MGEIIQGNFFFDGEIESSKSLMNRALVIQSFAPHLKILGGSNADDVVDMQSALQKLLLNSKEPIDCGHAGTVLRFLALRAARMKGVFNLTGSERLFSRPHQDLLPLLGQLGVDASFDKNILTIRSQGWRVIVDGVHVNADRSSQFASAVLLSAWELPFAINMILPKRFVSEGYWNMTLELVKKMGMNLNVRGQEMIIPAHSKVSATEYVCEPDLSSAFAVAALAVVDGEAKIQNFPIKSLQPDFVFVQILKDMGCHVEWVSKNSAAGFGILRIGQANYLKAIDMNIESSPDLFPVLSVLCALARGESRIEGISHLAHKESHRLERSRDLLRQMGADICVDGESAVIIPVSMDLRATLMKKSQGRASLGASLGVKFDVDQDHRMAMAVEVARHAGFDIYASDPSVVNKSFPKFFEISGGTL